jgi:CubicO group peptidase (beta-lactamase class C family)
MATRLPAGYGWANRELQLPFTPDTPMDGASIAKTFTAAGLLLLSDEKRLDLNDPVAAHLSAFPYPNHRVIDLLTHAAGLPDYEWFDTLVVAGEPRTNDTHLGAMAQRRPALPFAPGAAFAYDNVAYDMAAMVIERVAGTSYAEFISTRFARPLRLVTSCAPPASPTGARVPGAIGGAGRMGAERRVRPKDFTARITSGVSAVDSTLGSWLSGLMGRGRCAALTPGRLADGSDTGSLSAAVRLGRWCAALLHWHHNGFTASRMRTTPVTVRGVGRERHATGPLLSPCRAH